MTELKETRQLKYGSCGDWYESRTRFTELICQLESHGLLSCALSAQNVFFFFFSFFLVPVAVKKSHKRLPKFLY